MEKRILGKTGLSVSAVSFGAIKLPRISLKECEILLNRALDSGINYIDTADCYGDSEEKIGQALKKRRQEFTLSTADAGKGFCRNCGYCLPCPEGIPIPDVFRYENYYRRYGLKDWAKEQYGILASNVQDCSDCRTCMEKCPYGVPIPTELRQAHKILKST
jgi:predicted aldo/keto reductase-like oxidoreductase